MRLRLCLAFLLALPAGEAAYAALSAYTQVSGSSNPFNGVDVGSDSAPTFVDIDNDGDLDAFVGTNTGVLRYFRNTGSATAPVFAEQTGAGNPFDGFDVGSNAKPTCADLDADGDEDCFVGADDGFIYYFPNEGTPSVPDFPSGFGVDLGRRVAPVLGGIFNSDGDNDTDLIVGIGGDGSLNGRFRVFDNTGDAANPELTELGGASNPLNGVDVGSRATPSLGDLDGDGDLDLLVGEAGGQYFYFENTGNATVPVYTERTGVFNPFDAFDVGNRSAPAIVDIDGDGDLDLISGAADGLLDFFQAGPPASGGSGRFNAVEVAADAVSGRVYTKISAVNFNLDIVALDAAGAFDASYQGNVDIELLDAEDDSGAIDAVGCRSTWSSVQSLGTLNIRNPDDGRRTLTNINYTNSLRKARLRMSDGSLSGCSKDSFALRPNSITVVATDASDSLPGTARTLNVTSASGTPTHRAGQPFTLRVTGLNASGAITANYDGSPSLSATITSPVLGANAGTVAATSWSSSGGVSRSDNASYSEVGAFRLSVADTDYAQADAGDVAYGMPASQMQIGPATLNVGRFTPDHFTVAIAATPRLTPGCGTFTYFGQPFAFFTPPALTVTAVNADGVTTSNYTGSLFKLQTATLLTGRSYASNSATAITVDSPSATAPDTGNGVTTVTYEGAVASRLRLSRPASPLVPLSLEIALNASIADSEGIAYAGTFTVGGTGSGSGIAFGSGGADKEFRYGRLRMLNAYGTETAGLDVPLRLEYWTTLLGGGESFVRSDDDACIDGSAILPAHVALSGALAGETGALGASFNTGSAAGTGQLGLSAPSAGGSGRVDLILDLAPSYSWLQVDNDADDIYSENPQASAFFGRYADDTRRVHTRELVR